MEKQINGKWFHINTVDNRGYYVCTADGKNYLNYNGEWTRGVMSGLKSFWTTIDKAIVALEENQNVKPPEIVIPVEIAKTICRMEAICHEYGEYQKGSGVLLKWISEKYPALVGEFNKLPWSSY